MGKRFTAILPDGTRRFAADMGYKRSAHFCEIAWLLEPHVGLSCGIHPDNGMDEYLIQSDLFLAFFERLWRTDSILESDGSLPTWVEHECECLFPHWAGLAAGMLENMTLQERDWIDRRGERLAVQRYLRPFEIDEMRALRLHRAAATNSPKE